MPPRLPPIRLPEKLPGWNCHLRPFSSIGYLRQEPEGVKEIHALLKAAAEKESVVADVAPRLYDGRLKQAFDLFKPMTSMLNAQEERSQASRRAALESIAEHGRSQDLERMMTRRWKIGDVYAPHDLSPVEMKKWRTRRPPLRDAFDVLAMNPLHEYKNFSMMSEYISSTGRIKHSSETGLRPRNQRRIAKAIRRSIGLGIMPSVYQHPELLEHQARSKGPSGRRV